MRSHFCTITTISHLFKVYALFDSIQSLNSSAEIHVLVTDGEVASGDISPKIHFYYRNQIKDELAAKINEKYAPHRDKLRWSLKPCFLNYLLNEVGIEKVIYTDNDIAFFGEFDFLFDYLNEYNIILTPHNYPRNPESNQNWLEANFKVGIFNAGFIGVNRKASETLTWWGRCCLYRCEKNPVRGLFDDQKYLDLFPIIEPGTFIIPHQGCNVADWNEEICKRQNVGNEILINGKWPVIFIHFNSTTIRTLLRHPDNLLIGYFHRYISYIKKYHAEINMEAESYKSSLSEKIKLSIWKALNRLNNPK